MIPIPSGTALRYKTSTAGTRTIVPHCDGTINSVVEQSDGKIIFVGIFTSVNGVSNARGIARLNSNGSVDTLFNTNAGTGATASSGLITDVVLQSDGKIIVIGQFNSFNGSTATRIARLNSDGTLDTAFMANIGTGPTTSHFIYAIALQPDGKIVLSGSFVSWNGETSAGDMVRLNSDGTRDSSFAFNDPSDVLGNINAMAVQSDGKIVIVGDITEVKGTACNGVARLNSDGSVDTTFTTAVQGPYDSENTPVLNDVAIQPDGKIIIVGSFPQWIVNSVALDAGTGIIRLNSDGTVNFRDGTTASYSNYCVYIQSDGSFLVGGNESLVRVTSGGTISSNFGPGSGQDVYDVIQLSSGDIFAVGSIAEWQGNTAYGGFVKINSTTLAVSMSDFNPLPDLVFAIVVGGGGRGGVTHGVGGGGGAIVWGLVPKSTSVTVGVGAVFGSSAPSNGDPSRYSTLFAQGGYGGGSNGGGFGSGSGSGGGVAQARSALMYTVGGSGGASVTSTGNIAGSAGGSGTSGGSGGGATNSASGGTTTGGIGGSGFIGGGGGAARITASSSSAATAGAGGAGVYAGGTGATLTGTSLKYCGGGGGGGYLGAGGNGTSATTNVFGNATGGYGGLGGGGGGGSPSNTLQNEGPGGTGCVLLYW